MNFFDVILGMFVEPAQKVAEILAKHASSFFHAQLILNTIISILFMIWAYKRVKEGDMFEFKTAMGVVVFIAFVGFINWAMDNPTTYMNMLKDTIFYPSNKLTEIITNSMSSLQIVGNNNLTLGSLIDKSYYSIIQLYREVFSDLGWKTFFTMFPMLIIFLLLVLAQILLIGLILIIVLITLVETLTWLSLGFAVLPLALFPQTKGMLFSYLKKLISLTFYQPCIMVVAFLNFSMIESITLKIPTKAEIINGFYNKGHIIDQMIENGSSQAINNFQNAMGAYTSVLGFFIILILGSVVCFFLIKRVPDFINNIFG
ncbi:type IV secretion system protein, partial [Helicobacter suis]|uniref:type IV secretion system protein n=1 Tax=Helicobacter suis TaxID=104628 RepID=UPI00159705A4